MSSEGNFIIALLMIIAGIYIFWIIIKNSKKQEAERQELRKAQLQALKRGRVNIDLKSNMRKLK